jgi:large subunit ribosomal protein L13
MTIIDGTDLILGRAGTRIAKRAILGEKIDVVNCEKLVISGKRDKVLAQFRHERARGIPAKGPFIPRMPHMFVKRSLRGMFPYKKPRGREAFERVKFHIGVPESMKDKKFETIEEANKKNLHTLNKVTVYQICQNLGWKGL